MSFSYKGVVKGNAVLVLDKTFCKYDGAEVVVNVPAVQSKNGYPKNFWKLFGADTDTGFEIPNEIDFEFDLAREKI